jgi:hypothetical protein
MAVTTLQITQSGSAKQIAPIGTYARWITFQNNAAGAMHVGDANVSATRGVSVPPGGSNFAPPPGTSDQHNDLGQWWTIGTNTQVLDVIYDAMN